MWFPALLMLLRTVGLALWLVLKPILGWILIVVGLIGMPMPIMNGVIFLVIGIALVGPRNKVIRWSRVRLKLLLARWAALDTPVVGPLGRLANRSAQTLSRQTRRLSWWFRERNHKHRVVQGEQARSGGD